MTTTAAESYRNEADQRATTYRARYDKMIAGRRRRAARNGTTTSTDGIRQRYALEYGPTILAKRAQKIAQLSGDAALLFILAATNRREPQGKAFYQVRDWARYAGLGRNATLAGLKRLHAQGLVDYTGGTSLDDRGVWHSK